MKKQSKHTHLGNPAVATAVTTYAAQNPKMVKRAVNIGLIITGGVIVSGLGLAYYHLFWKYRFKKMPFDPRYAPSNVSQSQARVKANALYEAFKGVGTDNDVWKETFKGVNRNGFIAIYNAFGKREPARLGLLPSFGNKNHLDLIEYMRNDLSNTELTLARRLVGGEGLF